MTDKQPHPFDEWSTTPPAPQVQPPRFAVGRNPDPVGYNRYVPKTRDGAMAFRKEFLKSELEPPADKIRRLLTQLEFEDQVDDRNALTIEHTLQLIEAQIDIMRVKIRRQN